MKDVDDFDFNQDNSIEFNEEYEALVGIGIRKIKC